MLSYLSFINNKILIIMELNLKTFFNLKVLAVLLVLGFLFFLDLTVKKNMREKEVKQFVVSILEDWKNGDVITPMEKWDNVNHYPPINDLVSYNISRVRFFKNQSGSLQAHFLVLLEFAPFGPLPTGKKWIFELSNNNFKWKVNHFGIAE